MNTEYLITIASTGFAVALAHAALPTHWLPFVLAGRAQHWTRSRTFAVIAAAGGAHVIFTTLLGALIVWLGIEITHEVGELFVWVAAAILFAFGLWYLFRQFRGRGHEHHHSLSQLWSEGVERVHEHEVQGVATRSRRAGDRVAVGSLLSMLTLSPCESFLPIYLSGIPYGWTGFAVLSGVLAFATLGGMMILAWMAQLGLDRVNARSFERYENGIVGVLLCALSLLLLLVH